MAPLYLLDTDTCSYVMRRAHPALLARLTATPLEHVAISVVTAAELLYGTRLSARPEQARHAYDAFVLHLQVLDWTIQAADHYADIRADLKRRGEPIGANDLMIAAHARSLGAVIVTNNVREFGRVDGLTVENWI